MRKEKERKGEREEGFVWNNERWNQGYREVYVMEEGSDRKRERALNEDGKMFVIENMELFGLSTFKTNSQIYGGLFFVSSISNFFFKQRNLQRERERGESYANFLVKPMNGSL